MAGFKCSKVSLTFARGQAAGNSKFKAKLTYYYKKPGALKGYSVSTLLSWLSGTKSGP